MAGAPTGSKTETSSTHRQLMVAARELLIDLERTHIEAASSLVTAASALPSKAVHMVPANSSDARHREVLLAQVDELRAGLVSEQRTCEALRAENEQLTSDVRSLASQLKQERAASNAVLTATGRESTAVPDSAGGTGELTLASAASQILLLRREVKFLQKQWNHARVDQHQATTREQMQQLRDEATEAIQKAAAAEEVSALQAAKVRMAVRELKAARAMVTAQQQRMQRRSLAQKEVISLKEQLGKAHDAFVAQQQTLKQLQLRERLRRQRDDDDDADDVSESRVDAAVAEAEAAHMGLGLMVLANELSGVERAWKGEKDSSAECAPRELESTLGAAAAPLLAGAREESRWPARPHHARVYVCACVCVRVLARVRCAAGSSQSRRTCHSAWRRWRTIMQGCRRRSPSSGRRLRRYKRRRR